MYIVCMFLPSVVNKDEYFLQCYFSCCFSVSVSVKVLDHKFFQLLFSFSYFILVSISVSVAIFSFSSSCI